MSPLSNEIRLDLRRSPPYEDNMDVSIEQVTSDCFIAQGLSRTVLDKCLMKERNEGLKWILGH